MQIPENLSNNDIRDALLQLRQEFDRKFDQFEQRFDELDQKVERLDYKFDTYQKGTDGMVRMATTIIIATATVVVLSNLNPAVTAIVTALAQSSPSGS